MHYIEEDLRRLEQGTFFNVFLWELCRYLAKVAEFHRLYGP